MQVYYINAPFDLSQNTNIYAQDISQSVFSNYDYVLNISTGWESMNSLFSQRQFIQNIQVNNVDISLNIDVSNVKLLLSTSNVASIYSTNPSIIASPAYNTLKSGNTNIGFRMLEIVATKIFGHAHAQAAIKNDSDFYQNNITSTGGDSLIAQIGNGINNSLVSMSNYIFNAYVRSNQYGGSAFNATNNNINNDGDDTLGIEYFNFYNSQWEFPVYLTGLLSSNFLMNGPNVGGNVMENGTYRVPLLLRFT